MWLSGYARKKKRLIIKEKLKWNLKGLHHLRKLIYSETLRVKFVNFEKIMNSAFGNVSLFDFQVEKSRIRGFFKTEDESYLKFTPTRKFRNGI